MGDLQFGEKGEALHIAPAIDEDHLVGVGAESAIGSRNVIGHDEVEVFPFQLLCGIFNQVFAFPTSFLSLLSAVVAGP